MVTFFVDFSTQSNVNQNKATVNTLSPLMMLHPLGPISNNNSSSNGTGDMLVQSLECQLNTIALFPM